MPENVNPPATEMEAPVTTQSEAQTFSEGDVQNLMKALKAEREARKNFEKEAKERASQLERFANINPEEYSKLQEEVARAAQLQAQYGEAREAIEAKYSKQAEEAASKATAAEQSLQELRKKYALEKVFFAAGGRTDAADGVSFFDMLANQVGNRFRQEADGSLTVLDGQGDPILDKESGKRISPEDYIATFKSHPVYGTFFVGQKGSGSGLGYGGVDASGRPVQDLSDLSSSELFQTAFR
jgi:hypothetical protein